MRGSDCNAGSALCRVEESSKSQFHSTILTHQDFGQTKWGMSLIALGYRGGGNLWGNSAIGEGVTCIPMFLEMRLPATTRSLLRCRNETVIRMYRIKSPLEEYERVAAENLLVRSERLFTGRGSGAELSPRIDNAAKADNCLVAAAGRRGMQLERCISAGAIRRIRSSVISCRRSSPLAPTSA